MRNSNQQAVAPERYFLGELLAGIGVEIILFSSLADVIVIIPGQPGNGLAQVLGALFGLALLGGALAWLLRIGWRPRLIQRASWIKPSPTARGERVLPAMLLILLLAVTLRLYHLNVESLWYDELASWYRTTWGTVSDALLKGDIDSMWPAYHILLFFSARLLGDSEYALRFPSAAFGILQIPLMYQLGRRLYSHREGILGALFMAAFQAPLFYSQEARTYSMLVFFVLLAACLWTRWMRKLVVGTRVSQMTLFRYFLAATTVLYLHPFGVMMIALQGLGTSIISLQTRRGAQSLLVTYLAIGLAALPLATTISGMEHIVNSWISPPGPFSQALEKYLVFAFSDSAGLALAVTLIGLVALVITLRRMLRSHAYTTSQPFPSTLALVLWFVGPFSGTYLFSILVKPALVNRYLLMCLPALYLLLAHAIVQICLPLHFEWGIAFFLAVSSINTMLIHNKYYAGLAKEQFRQAVYYVAAQDHNYPGSLIVGYCDGPTAYFDYYFKRAGSYRRIDVEGGTFTSIPLVEREVTGSKARYSGTSKRTPAPKIHSSISCVALILKCTGSSSTSHLCIYSGLSLLRCGLAKYPQGHCTGRLLSRVREVNST